MVEWDFIEYQSLASQERSAFAMGPFGSKITKENYVDHGVPVVRGVNLARGIFVDDDFVFVSDDKADEIASANVEPGDLIFTHRGTIGQVSMIPRAPRFERYVIGSSQVKTRLDESKAVPEFYYYWFRSSGGQRSILANSSTVGVPGISTPLTSIRNLRVPLPRKEEQQAVAEVLGALDDKIAVNERVSVTHEGLVAQHFEGLTEVGQGVGAGVLASRLVEFGPKEAKPTTNEAVYVDMAALSTTGANIEGWSRRAPKGGTRFRNGDTLLARITPCLENGKTGHVDFMGESEVGVGSTEFIVMRSRPGVPKEFSYFLARSRSFRENAIRKMVGSSGRQRVSAADASQFSFPFVNDEDALAKFGEAAVTWSAHRRALASQSRTLAALRDTLLPQLMSGKLRVRDAERIVEDAV